jgi:hypothetical protein
MRGDGRFGRMTKYCGRYNGRGRETEGKEG